MRPRAPPATPPAIYASPKLVHAFIDRASTSTAWTAPKAAKKAPGDFSTNSAPTFPSDATFWHRPVSLAQRS